MEAFKFGLEEWMRTYYYYFPSWWFSLTRAGFFPSIVKHINACTRCALRSNHILELKVYKKIAFSFNIYEKIIFLKTYNLTLKEERRQKNHRKPTHPDTGNIHRWWTPFLASLRTHTQREVDETRCMWTRDAIQMACCVCWFKNGQ